jgi:hypothetical protein
VGDRFLRTRDELMTFRPNRSGMRATSVPVIFCSQVSADGQPIVSSVRAVIGFANTAKAIAIGDERPRQGVANAASRRVAVKVRFGSVPTGDSWRTDRVPMRSLGPDAGNASTRVHHRSHSERTGSSERYCDLSGRCGQGDILRGDQRETPSPKLQVEHRSASCA